MRDLLEGLVIISPAGKAEPAVAEHWASEDNRVFTFHLRDDARWSNGDPVLASDFVYSWQRLAAPGTGSTCASFLTEAGIEHARAIQLGNEPLVNLGVKALDSHTLEVTLEVPNALFVSMLGRTCALPLHPATVEQYTAYWTKPGRFVGNGAFILDKWTVNERVELRRNPHYWNAEKVKLDRVTYLPTSPTSGELNRYLAGEIDITSSVANDQLSRLMAEYPDQLTIIPTLVTSGWTVNTLRPPFTDERLRRALSYAIDRDVMADKVAGLSARAAYTLSPQMGADNVLRNSEWQRWPQSEREAHAQALYKEAGYGPENPLEVRMQVLKDGGSERYALATAAMWEEVLGAKVALERYDWKTLVERLQQQDFDISIYVYEAHHSEPLAFLAGLVSTAPDPSAYSNPEYDDLIETAREAVAPEHRNALYRQAELLLAEDMPFIPLLQGALTRMVKPHVQGYKPNPLSYVYSKDLWVADDGQTSDQGGT
ncbi:peptide ABC transporter substrate-binding protein [Microbulbifer guangxiensis]|uniref:peptide ABC transporter substrate-binding protein n=1 Tax=Microbulbifer guangxiensis TaxID=2904249 RepID=UPI001F2B8F26|nr:peptide ABC transporter substrate-binding protein [Microbulbifer guangxiensis]